MSEGGPTFDEAGVEATLARIKAMQAEAPSAPHTYMVDEESPQQRVAREALDKLRAARYGAVVARGLRGVSVHQELASGKIPESLQGPLLEYLRTTRGLPGEFDIFTWLQEDSARTLQTQQTISGDEASAATTAEIPLSAGHEQYTNRPYVSPLGISQDTRSPHVTRPPEPRYTDMGEFIGSVDETQRISPISPASPPFDDLTRPYAYRPDLDGYGNRVAPPDDRFRHAALAALALQERLSKELDDAVIYDLEPRPFMPSTWSAAS
jgi:hypothetical protein